MTSAELKQEVSIRNPHFFTRKTMRSFGDTMANYGVRAITVPGHPHSHLHPHPYQVWELYHRHPVKYGNQASAYFSMTNFARVWPDNDKYDSETG